MSKTQDRFLRIRDKSGAEVVSTVPAACASCSVCIVANELTTCPGRGKRRRGTVEIDGATVYFCTGDPDLLASSRSFKRELELYGASLSHFATLKVETVAAEAHKTRRLLHNLISLNAHALQDLYSVVSQERLGAFAGYRSQKEFLTTFLRQRPADAAEIFLRSLKNAAAVKSELAVFQKLYEPSPKLQFGWHEIHRVLMNVGNYFFQDFSDQQIALRIENCEARIKLDYESIQVAFYHLLDNAVKYALPGSDLHIHFSRDQKYFKVVFDMTSLAVAEGEKDAIFADGVSGQQARELSKAGQGLGMKLIEELLKLNEGILETAWGAPLPTAGEGLPRYALNRLVARFPMSVVR